MEGEGDEIKAKKKLLKGIRLYLTSNWGIATQKSAGKKTGLILVYKVL